MDKGTSSDQSIAVIQNNISYIQKDVASINQSLKELNAVFATKEQLSDTAKQVEERLIRLESMSHLWRWLSPTLAAAVAVVVEYLFLFYIQHLH